MRIKWREIYGYMVSNEGNVKSRLGKPVKLRLSKSGRPYVSLSVNGQRVNKTLAVLVLECFVGERPNSDCVVGYKDKNWLNNRLDNIFWKDKVQAMIRYDIQNSTAGDFEMSLHHSLPIEMIRRIRSEPSED